MSTKFNCTTTALSAVLIASFVGTTTSILHAEGIKPDATLLRFPDVSQSHIVFTYANDLWLVPKSGGSAQKVASPHGQVMLPRFSPDGNTIAFVGNYEGGRDLYTLPIDGTNPIETAMRLTYHPINCYRIKSFRMACCRSISYIKICNRSNSRRSC